MNVKKVLIALLIVVFCSFNFVGCSQEEEVQVSEKIITIGVMPDVESIPFIIAQKNGYFEQEGVQVNIEHFTSAKDRDSALQSGKLDGVITDMLAVLFANEGGINLRMMARTDGNIELMAGKDSGVTAAADLTGKDIGLSTNTIMEYTTDKMLEAAGLNAGEVNKIAIPPLPTRLEMLQGGKVDAAILPEPLAGLAVKNGAIVLSSTDELQNKAGAIAFTAESIEGSPDEIIAVFRAYNDAVGYLQNEPLENYVDFIIEEQGFPAGIKDSLQLPKYQQAELPDEEVFYDVVQWMQDKELIQDTYKYEDLVVVNVMR